MQTRGGSGASSLPDGLRAQTSRRGTNCVKRWLPLLKQSLGDRPWPCAAAGVRLCAALGLLFAPRLQRHFWRFKGPTQRKFEPAAAQPEAVYLRRTQTPWEVRPSAYAAALCLCHTLAQEQPRSYFFSFERSCAGGRRPLRTPQDGYCVRTRLEPGLWGLHWARQKRGA